MPQFESMRLGLILAFVALLLLGGCTGDDHFIGGKRAPVIYMNVVSLSPGATEIAATTFGRGILGRTASCNSPARVRSAPIVMKGLKPDYEHIAKLKPDCVLYDPDLFSKADIDKFKELGIPTFAFGGDTVDEYIDQVYEFGRFSAAPEMGSAYLDRVIREHEAATASLPNPPVKTCLILPGDGGEHMIAGQDGFQADVIRSGGGTPIGPKGKLFVTLNAEWLIQANPELIIVAGDETSFMNDPRFKNLDAVRKHHVYPTNPDITLRRGAYVDRFIKRVGELVNIVRRKV